MTERDLRFFPIEAWIYAGWNESFWKAAGWWLNMYNQWEAIYFGLIRGLSPREHGKIVKIKNARWEIWDICSKILKKYSNTDDNLGKLYSWGYYDFIFPLPLLLRSLVQVLRKGTVSFGTIKLYWIREEWEYSEPFPAIEYIPHGEETSVIQILKWNTYPTLCNEEREWYIKLEKIENPRALYFEKVGEFIFDINEYYNIKKELETI